MSIVMNDDIKRWTAKRKAALIINIIQGRTTVSNASGIFASSPSEIKNRADEIKRGIENSLKFKLC